MASSLGARVFGVADLDFLKKQIPNLLAEVPGGDFSHALVMGIRLEKAVFEGLTDRPTPLYFHHYRQANYQLDRLAFLVADRIQELGYRALAIPASQIIATNPLRGHISHKLLGWCAGIGFIGRSGLLVHPAYGAQVRYVSVLTDMPLPADTPSRGDCGTCRACVAVCPAHAIHETKDDFDLPACARKLSEFAKLPFISQHICGVCVKACHGKSNSQTQT